MSISTTSLWLFAFLGNQVFPLMQKHLGNGGTFWCFSGAALINLLCVSLFVPETKGRSLEEIEDIWTGPPQPKRDGRARGRTMGTADDERQCSQE